MLKSFFAFIIPFLMLGFSELHAQENEVLVFYKTEGFRHKSIPKGIKTIEALGSANNFLVDKTKDAGQFSNENLKKYELVLFLNTTGDVLNLEQQKAFENYMGQGGNYFGIHAAADTEFNWPWYGKLVGAYFIDHPKVQEATVHVEKPKHPSVAHLPETWRRTDEWYNYKNIHPEINVLLRLDEGSYTGGKNGKQHPIAWFRELEGGGIAMYTGGGHTMASYNEPAFREHLLQSILFLLEEEQ